MKKILLYSLTILVLSLLLVGNYACRNHSNDPTDSTQMYQGNISISGAFAMYPMVVCWAEEYKKIHPGITIDISAGGAGKGMTDVLSGMVDIGMISRNISQEEIQKGAWFIALTKDAVLPTIHTGNPVYRELMVQGINKDQLQQIFLQDKVMSWGEIVKNSCQEKITHYTRSDACGAAEMWGKFLGKNQESLTGVGVFGDPGIADAVKKDKNGLGYNNVIYVYDIKTRKPFEGISVLPIDINLNHKIDAEEDFYQNLDSMMLAIANGKYPSPPARDLYFVCKNFPKNQRVVAFIQWILTEGQRFVGNAGYVNLPKEQIATQLEKLNLKK